MPIEAVDAVGGLVDAVKAAGAVVGPRGPRDDRRHFDVDFSGAGEVDNISAYISTRFIGRRHTDIHDWHQHQALRYLKKVNNC